MADSDLIRVMIVDDHGMVRRGLLTYLKNEADVQVVGEARDGQEAVQLCEQLQPDVILMDLMMPKLDGVAATRLICKQWPQVRVIALTSFAEKELVQNALQAGALSYLLKNATGTDVAAAIRSACAGRSTLAAEAIEALIQPAVIEPPVPGVDFTSRERDVLALLVKGLSNPEIADRLSISRATVKVHISNILAKLEVSNRGEAIAAAIQRKLVT